MFTVDKEDGCEAHLKPSYTYTTTSNIFHKRERRQNTEINLQLFHLCNYN